MGKNKRLPLVFCAVFLQDLIDTTWTTGRPEWNSRYALYSHQIEGRDQLVGRTLGDPSASPIASPRTSNSFLTPHLRIVLRPPSERQLSEGVILATLCIEVCYLDSHRRDLIADGVSLYLFFFQAQDPVGKKPRFGQAT